MIKMIMQTYLTIQEYNVTGLDGILIYLSTAIPLFIPIMLIAIYLAVSMMIYLGTRKFGQGDIFAALSAGGFFTAVVGTMMTLTFGVINYYVLTMVILILILSFIILFLRRNRD